MNGIIKKAGLGMALAASTLAAAAPADAQYRGYRGYRGYHHGHGNGTTNALLGGIVGLGIGAAIASSNRDRYYDRGYYADRGYYYNAPPRVIYREQYYAPPPPRVYYERDYYAPGYYDRGYYGY